MASLEQHMADCTKLLGAPFEAVHRWMDEFFAKEGPLHRKHHHHIEGVEEARRLFGDDGANAAIVHILRDCRNIPHQQDYENGTADILGLKRRWPVSAYIRYSEEAFEALVNYTIEGPMGLVFWAFVNAPHELQSLMAGLSRLSVEQQQEAVQQWSQSQASFREIRQKPLPSAAPREADEHLTKYFENDYSQQFIQSIREQFPSVRPAIVSIDQVISPLVVIDYEYAEQLKASLASTEWPDIVRFALPTDVEVPLKSMADPSGKSVTFVSREKTLFLAPLVMNAIPGLGIEVRFLVASSPQLVLISSVGGRLIARNGTHRLYLLASLGVQETPCLLIEESDVPVITAAYPTFSPQVLALPRPPLIVDAFDPALRLRMPIVRASKVIRISGEELIIPVD